MKIYKLATLLVATLGLSLSACNGTSDDKSNDPDEAESGAASSAKKQRKLTQKEASAVAKDIDKKQKAKTGKSSSSLAAPRLAKRLPAKYMPVITNNEWEYGDDDYWQSEYNFDLDDYETDWEYSRDDDYDDWAYDESSSYDTWLNERSARKTIKIPEKATLNMYMEADMTGFPSEYGLSGGTKIEATIAYDFSNYYAKEDVKVKMGSTLDETSTIEIYYKDNKLHTKMTLPSPAGSIDEEYPATDSEVAQIFNGFKDEIQECFIDMSLGESEQLLGYVDEFKDFGLESAYYSDDAGNLVMDIKGKTSYEESGYNVDVEADMSVVWDEYFMRSCNVHMKEKGNIPDMGDIEVTMHMLYGYSDKCDVPSQYKHTSNNTQGGGKVEYGPVYTDKKPTIDYKDLYFNDSNKRLSQEYVDDYMIFDEVNLVTVNSSFTRFTREINYPISETAEYVNYTATSNTSPSFTGTLIYSSRTSPDDPESVLRSELLFTDDNVVDLHNGTYVKPSTATNYVCEFNKTIAAGNIEFITADFFYTDNGYDYWGQYHFDLSNGLMSEMDVYYKEHGDSPNYSVLAIAPIVYNNSFSLTA